MSDPEPTKEPRDPAVEEFYTRFGKALAAWADVENSLADWFRRAIEPEQGAHVNADGIFYSARSFNGRADMLKAAASSSHLSAEERKFIRKALKKATDYNTFRAKLAHRVAVEKKGFGPDEDGMFLHEGDDPFGRNEHLPAIDTKHLANATLNFDALKWIVSITGIPGGIEPEEGLRLVGLLPTEPHLAVDSHLLEELYEA